MDQRDFPIKFVMLNFSLQRSICILVFIYLILAASLMLSLSRWGCLATLTITYINSTLSPGSNALLDSQLLAAGNLLAQTCRVLQFAALIYGVSKFSNILSSLSGLRALEDARKKFLTFENCCKKEHSPCTVHTFILLGILIFYFAATVPPPALLTTWFKEFALWHDDDERQQHSSVGYTILAWFHHLSDLIIRLLMGVATRLVMVAWSSAGKNLQAVDKSNDTKLKKFSKIVSSYKEIGKMAAALQDIFQEWFVMSWVVYFIGVTGNTTLVLKALFKGLFSTSSHRSWFYFAHLINDFAAFLIPYICGGLMNHYHEKYRDTLEEVQEHILSNSDILSECMHQKANLIPSNPKYMFVPSLCCLNIPLESAGYSFTLILTSFAFVLSFITAFTNV